MELFRRYSAYNFYFSQPGFSLDISHVPFDDEYLASMAGLADRALAAMTALESGSIANPDEGRMVGHYWLRAPQLAPDKSITDAIVSMGDDVAEFGRDLRRGRLRGSSGTFTDAILVGIGGSALGPRLLRDVHVQDERQVALHILDNADPDTVNSLFGSLADRLGRTLTMVISKSGTTPTPLRLLTEVRENYSRAGIDFAAQAVAITTEGSKLDRQAIEERWLGRFPCWDWVGGRTSITAASGLLPAAIIGADVRCFLAGAAEMDTVTRNSSIEHNPAMLIALMWYWAGGGKGVRDMVILPYRDRLAGLTRYLQQLIMESIGKAADRTGQQVHQGLSVYGNIGEPDQHAILQQLRDGADSAFVVFIGAHTTDRPQPSDRTSLDDYLFANLVDTRNALAERGRSCLTLMFDQLSLHALGALIALFERAVGLYAELIDINAYHQPGVLTHTAADLLQLQDEILRFLRGKTRPQTVSRVAAGVGASPDLVYDILDHLEHSSDRTVRRSGPRDPGQARFLAIAPGDAAAAVSRNGE